MEQFIYSTYTIVLPIIVTTIMGYVVWLLKNQKKDRDANSKGTMLLLAVLVILGVVTDPTTKGITDSDQALTYTEPKK